MKITPVNDNILIEPLLRTDKKHAELEDRAGKAGLYVPAKTKPDNKENFEGIPNEGYIRYLPEDYKGELTVGLHVVFRENQPKGFEFEGVKLFPIQRDQIVGVIEDQ